MGVGVPKKDATQAASLEDKRKDSKDPFRGSILTLDQSITTQTIGIGPNPQTYTPYYQLWLSFRPRYYITDHLIVSARVDFYKELTNSAVGETTTDYREDVFGDLWTNLVYDTTVGKSENTKVNAGLRFLWPLSKVSQGEGIYVQAGVTAGISQKVPIHDASAPFLNNIQFKLGAWYNHPFSNSTTPNNPNFTYVRQDTDDQSVISNQLAGNPLIDHQLLISTEAALQITPRVDFALDFILVNQWHYPAPGNGNNCVQTESGTACAPSMEVDGADVNFTQNTWVVAALSWDVFDQLTLGLGYFNLNNELNAEGQNRSLGQLLWSPEGAHFFFDITANLDAIYESVAPKKGQLREAAQMAREQTFVQWSQTPRF
jgi:hypothetical protein